uniref:F-box domain-containing protein n=1 Tax=Oryza glumipatula TaxID=40148 RepID=A0A0D9YZJ8_9ORYZ
MNRKGSDRLSKLPDDILLNILDRLHVRDAARTSVLSRRWRHLPSMLSQLVIDFVHFMPNGASMLSDDVLVWTNAAVVEATKSILERRNPDEYTIHLLRMLFYLNEGDCISIGQTVGHAMTTQKVEMAEFTIIVEKLPTRCTDDDLIDYGRRFMSFFDACPTAFGVLTRLIVGNLRFGESDIHNVLKTCQNLQYLRLFNCDSGNLTVLQLEHPQLNVLNIANCRFESIKLNCLPKLAQLMVEGWLSFQDPLTFGYVPSLEAVRLAGVGLKRHKLVKLSKILGKISVRDLRLNFKSEKIWVQPELPQKLASVFYKLRLVNLFRVPEGCDLTWTMFILEAAPFLKELRMTVWDHWCNMEKDEEMRASLYSSNKSVEWESSAEDFKHHNLSVLTIFCFQSEDFLVAFIKRIMEVAVNLEDVFLYNMLACDTCKDIRSPCKFPRTKRQRCSLKKRINEGNSFAKFHFLTSVTADHVPISEYP